MGITIMLTFLGVIQGIAEFLPISSSGHLVILEHITVIKNALAISDSNINLFVNVALHIATLIAVIIYLRKEIYSILKDFIISIFKRNFESPGFKTAIYILIASIPAGIIGVAFHSTLEKIFSSVSSALVFLIINGFILISTKKIPIKDRNIEEMGVIRPLVVGFFQAFAILPGISRSGMTIAGGLFLGLKPLESAKFSFLIALPVIGGAGLLEGVKAAKGTFPPSIFIPLLIAIAVTIVVALISMKILFALMKNVKIDIFGYYTILLGVTGLVLINFVF